MQASQCIAITAAQNNKVIFSLLYCFVFDHFGAFFSYSPIDFKATGAMS